MIPNLVDGWQLREIDRVLVQTVMIQLGILPMERTDLDMRRGLQQLDPEEARKFRRKFRKEWRKAMASLTTAEGAPMTKSLLNKQLIKQEALKQRLGVGKRVPSRAERNARKKLVYDRLWNEIIEPILWKLDNPENEKKNA